MSIKINRAIDRAAVGRYRATSLAMLNHIPNALRASLTSTLMLDALYACAERSKAIHEADIVAAGVVWDSANRKLIELRHQEDV